MFWKRKPRRESYALPSKGAFILQVVGESHYQAALEAICGGRTEDGADDKPRIAYLILEDGNPYDPEAVRVEIDGRHVGHLSRPDARAFRAYLTGHGIQQKTVYCKAQIRGGWDRGPEDRGHFGVFLDFDLYQ
jgi:hypothetical protein